MKRLILIAILAATVFSCWAQKDTPMRAYNLYYDNDNAKAKECIDNCLKDEKTATKANAWLYKANIEYRLATEDYNARQGNSEYQYKYPTAAKEAYLAFKKAEELNKNVEASEMFAPYQALPILYPVLFIQGVNEMMDKKYESAKEVLALAIESYEMQKPPQYPLNGQLYYYYAYTLTMLNDDQQARNYYQKALDDGSEDINVFIGLIDSYKKENRRNEVLQLINKGLAKESSNAFLRVAEADYYYWIGEKETGSEKLRNLPKSVAETPENAINAANLFINDNMYDEAEELLVRAYRNAPTNKLIAHNLGVCCSNIGEYTFLEADKLRLSNKKDEFETLNAKSQDYLRRAANYFEKSLSNTTDDLSVLQRLRQIYGKLNMTEDLNRIENLIKKYE